MNKKSLFVTVVLVATVTSIVSIYLRGNGLQRFDLSINNNLEPDIINVASSSDSDVGVVTYVSRYGYEISYPEKWSGNDITDVYYKKDALNVYMIKPQEVADPYVQDHIMTISVEEKTLENFKKEVDLGHDIRIENFDELMPVSLNGLDGLYKPFENQESFYFFEKDGRLYSLHLHYDEAININKQESLSVLSTFKILE